MIERATGLAGIILLAATLAGCAVPPPDFNALSGDDVALRHPIELRQAWQEITLPFAHQIDDRTKE